MSSKGMKWTIAALSVALLLMTVLAAYTAFRHSLLVVSVAMAEEQTSIFRSIRDRASHGSAERSAECLDYVVSYYPSGAKQTKGSPLARMVEEMRAEVITQIIHLLREKTGRDLGDGPEAWIEEYAGERPEYSEGGE
jgi:hypothetical protein